MFINPLKTRYLLIHLKPDRDLQCDFDSPFWEESDCNWKYSATSQKLIRESVTTQNYNYWKRLDNKTSK